MTAFFSALVRRSDRRRAYAAMLQLDDHLLRDIGLTRGDLRSQIANVQFADLVGAHARS